MRYARCKIKNIAIPITEVWNSNNNTLASHIEEIDDLPNNCIRIKQSVSWCYNCCKECLR